MKYPYNPYITKIFNPQQVATTNDLMSHQGGNLKEL